MQYVNHTLSHQPRCRLPCTPYRITCKVRSPSQACMDMQHPLPFTSFTRFYSFGLHDIPLRSFPLIFSALSWALQYHNGGRIQIYVTYLGIWGMRFGLHIQSIHSCYKTASKYYLRVQFGTNQIYHTENDIQLSWELEVSQRTSRGQSNSFHNSHDLCITLQVWMHNVFLVPEINSREAGHSWVRHTFWVKSKEKSSETQSFY